MENTTIHDIKKLQKLLKITKTQQNYKNVIKNYYEYGQSKKLIQNLNKNYAFYS